MGLCGIIALSAFHCKESFVSKRLCRLSDKIGFLQNVVSPKTNGATSKKKHKSRRTANIDHVSYKSIAEQWPKLQLNRRTKTALAIRFSSTSGVTGPPRLTLYLKTRCRRLPVHAFVIQIHDQFTTRQPFSSNTFSRTLVRSTKATN